MHLSRRPLAFLIISVAFAGLLPAPPARADRLILRDKRTFQGIVTEKPDTVEVDTMVSGIRCTLTFRLDEYEEVIKEPLPEGFFTPGKKEESRPAEKPKETPRPKPAPPPPPPSPVKASAPVRVEKPEKVEKIERMEKTEKPAKADKGGKSSHVSLLGDGQWDESAPAAPAKVEKIEGAGLPAVMSSDGKFLLAASADAPARLWSLSSGTEVYRLQGEGIEARALALSRDVRLAATASGSLAQVWVLSGGKPVARVETDANVTALAFSADARQLIGGLADGSIRWWDAANGREARKVQLHSGAINALDLSPDGAMLASASDDGTLRLWDMNGKALAEVAHEAPVRRVVFSPNGKTVLTADEQRRLRLWTSAGAAVRALDPAPAAVVGLAFTGDGASVIAAVADQSARVIDTASGKETRRVAGHGAALGFAAATPDGRAVVTVGADRCARLWEGVTPAALAEVLKLEKAGKSNEALAAMRKYLSVTPNSNRPADVDEVLRRLEGKASADAVKPYMQAPEDMRK